MHVYGKKKKEYQNMTYVHCSLFKLSNLDFGISLKKYSIDSGCSVYTQTVSWLAVVEYICKFTDERTTKKHS